VKKLKVVTIFGTRPEAIKMAPLVKELENNSNINSIVCVTAQHREMLDQVLKVFDITPEYDLDIMTKSQTLISITTKTLERLSKVLEQIKPDIVLVHGDTTTTFVGSLAAFYQKIKVGHVEAGLRTFQNYYPYPEEMNRKLTGVLANLHFCPTVTNKDNLLREGVQAQKIYITGNTVIDALKMTVNSSYMFQNKILQDIDYDVNTVITVTAHRRENIGTPLINICMAIKNIAGLYPNVEVVFPVHPNPSVRNTVKQLLGECNRVRLISPLEVQDMHNLINRSYIVVTDSGGLQEEAPSLGKPVLVVRNETERPEAVRAGTVKVVGTECDTITHNIKRLMEDKMQYEQMAKAVNPYGDGKASSRIVSALLYEFGICKSKTEGFNVSW